MKTKDILIYTPFILIAVTYIVYFIIGKKNAIHPKVAHAIVQTNYFILAIGFLLVILSLFGYSLSSIWLPKILAWIYLITGCIMLINRRHSVKRVEKKYTNFLFYSPVILIVSWVTPMLGIWICYSFSLFFYTDESTIVFNDKNYLVKFEEGFLVYDYDPSLFKKHGIIQRRMKDLVLKEWNFERNIEIIEVDENSIQIKYYNQRNTGIDTLINI